MRFIANVTVIKIITLNFVTKLNWQILKEGGGNQIRKKEENSENQIIIITKIKSFLGLNTRPIHHTSQLTSYQKMVIVFTVQNTNLQVITNLVHD
jgi:hypothetical protein